MLHAVRLEMRKKHLKIILEGNTKFSFSNISFHGDYTFDQYLLKLYKEILLQGTLLLSRT